MENKITKREMFAVVIEMAEAAGREDVKEFALHEIDLLDAKADKARERAAKKKAETDALYDAVYAVLTETPQTTADILVQIPGEDATAGKIQARLRKMIEAGLVVKSDAKVDKRTVKAYAKVQ